MIEVEALAKSYGTFPALRGVSFTVEAGEVLAVLGPNGAGKTTTVEILEGYRDRDGGTATVLGMDPAEGGTELRRRVGIVLQETGADPYLTVTEILTRHAEYYPSPRAVGEVVELVGLAEKADARVKALSGGQKRRLDVALGLIGDPELLFLDEPTTGFDPAARRQAWEVVEGLQTLGKTVLLTTHYMDEAQALADRVLVVAAGMVIAEGPPESIGGRAEAPVEIRFALPDGVGPTDLPLEATTDGPLAVVSTDRPTSALAALTSWAAERGIGELESLEVLRPSLEEIYLQLVESVEDDR